MCCHAQESQLKGYTERTRWSSAAPIKSRKAQPCQLKLLLCPVKKEKCLILMPTGKAAKESAFRTSGESGDRKRGVQVWKGVTKLSDVTTQCCQEFFAKDSE